MKPSDPAAPDPVGNPAHVTVVLDEPTKRRNVVYAIIATVVGGLVGVFPFLTGLAFFLDPAIKKRKTSPADHFGDEPVPPFRRVATLAAIPNDGTPIQVPVIADLKDIWTVEPNQPIGAVYLRKVDGGKTVECFNAICPHAGCFVAYSAERKLYQCPCHTSSFETDGTRILPSPSPRNMDPLKVEVKPDGEVLVAFSNFYPGKEHREAKPA
ncbi:Cytochrome b6-f complex iron-sulfur subunit 1 [Anatilimnocola aggregata]|uniref:Cytochrome b6-f complex iron-sulfur subunit 1 n=1 Tax=Anatilimnocola aggregata TaxID=2528021 RepID=A0A517YAY8_9BACT|nr:Rieske 2Fe-2S domain-containing protein [Anatilimnocola aggregata]QDU27371.1 Cytochrome b6-f complex iron-sulfur subunit 1 [Anatilimnocola aggregata]